MMVQSIYPTLTPINTTRFTTNKRAHSSSKFRLIHVATYLNNENYAPALEPSLSSVWKKEVSCQTV